MVTAGCLCPARMRFVSFGDIIPVLVLQPCVPVYPHVGVQSNAGGVDRSGNVVGGHHLPMVSIAVHRVGIHPVAGTDVLHDSESCLIMQAMIVLVAA